MHLSTAHKQRLAQAARFATAGAMLVTSVGAATATPAFAQLTTNSTTLVDSQPSKTNTTYTVSFRPAASTVTAIKQVDMKFCSEAGTFTDPCTAPVGMGFGAPTATATGFGPAGGATTGTFTTASNVATFVVTTPGANEVATNDHAMTFTDFTNPTNPGTYYTRVRTYSDAGTAVIDNGTSAWAIVNRVTVSGTVLENLTFTVAAVTTGNCAATGGDTITATSATATTIPFGNLQSGSPRVGCHKVNTATNASQGYSTYVKEAVAGAAPSGGMCRQTATNCSTDGAAASVGTSDVIADVGLSTTAASWTTGGTIFGLGVNANGTEAETSFGTSQSYKSAYGTSGVKVATKSSSSIGVDTYVAYKLDIQANQVAGVYQNKLEYISTPTY